jgi:exopolysaccharide biosynthesis polyprenyl glycosylphosphotransferase
MTAEIRLFLNRYMATTIYRGSLPAVAPKLLALLFFWVIASLWLKTYRDKSDPTLVAALLGVAESTMTFCTAVVLVTFFLRQFGDDLSRSFVLILFPVSFLCLICSLAISILVARNIQKRWPSQNRLAVVGSAEESEEIVEAIRRSSGGEVLFLGLILPEKAAQRAAVGVGVGAAAGEAAFMPVLGTTRELAEVINRQCLDRIMFASESLSEPEVEHCRRVTKRMGILVSQPIRQTDPSVLVRHRLQYGMHLIDVEAVSFSRASDVAKRGVDIVLSLGLITLLSPLFALLAFLVRLTSKGPVFYKAPRVGRGGRYFTFWKFRTMYVRGPKRHELAERNESSGHLFKIRRDPRITPIGRIMRRLSLDELPQLFNVLAGDMSLVGPRPLPVEDLDADGMSRAFAEWAELRSVVRPGITGLWQVSGRSELPFARMIELDMEYVRRVSIRLDLSILARTFRAVFSGQGAF